MIGSDSPTLGIVGAGQLGRMLAEAAAPLGVDVVVSDPTPDPPAAPVASDTIEGGFADRGTIRRVAEVADYLTFEIELVDPDALEAVREETGVPVHPDPETLRTIQDKLVQKRRLEEAGVPVPPFRAVDDRGDLEDAIEAFGYPVMLKAREGGYDGRGNVPIRGPDDVDDALDAAPGAMLVEQMIDFERELSVIAVKGDGEETTFPVGENVHEPEILRRTIVPARAPDATRKQAQSVARDVLAEMQGRGAYGIELFEVDGEILVNEIAPRVHNSGHYTIEGAVTSQFEQHVRAVVGYPLGSTELRDPVVMANVLGDVDSPRPANLLGADAVLETPGAALHWYGKREARPLRKMGHVTVVPTAGEDREATAGETAGETREDLLTTARNLVGGLTFE
jgi:5-(carboxyamino)imidazole ribonucleotide synthase